MSELEDDPDNPPGASFASGDRVRDGMHGIGVVVRTAFGPTGNELTLVDFASGKREVVRADQLTIPGPGEVVSLSEHRRSKKPRKKPGEVVLDPINAASLAGKSLPKREYLDGFQQIPKIGVTALFGDGATGKSLLALQLMCGVATNGQWLGQPVNTGPVIYFSAEDPKDETHIRLHEVASAGGYGIGDLAGLHILFMAGQDCILGKAEMGSVLPTPLFEAFAAQAEAKRPALICIDNLVDVFAGNIIDTAQAKQFMHLLTGLSIRCGCPVLLLAHPSKSGMGDGGDGDGGTRAWSNSSRSRLYLQRVITRDGASIIEDDVDLRVLSNRKINYGRGGFELRLRWHDGVFVAEQDQPEAPPDPFGTADSKAERVFMQLLRWHLEHDKFVSPNKSVSYAPSVFAKHPQAEGIKVRQFETAMITLLDRNKIMIFTHGSPSNRRQHVGLPYGQSLADQVSE